MTWCVKEVRLSRRGVECDVKYSGEMESNWRVKVMLDIEIVG